MTEFPLRISRALWEEKHTGSAGDKYGDVANDRSGNKDYCVIDFGADRDGILSIEANTIIGLWPFVFGHELLE